MNAIRPAKVIPTATKTTSSSILTDLYHIVVLVEATMVNPNGDPDTANMPRQDPVTGHGIISNVCTKRKVRDYLAEVHKINLYHANGVVLREQRATVLRKNGIEPSREAVDAPQATVELVAGARRRAHKLPNKREAVAGDDLRRNQQLICAEYYDARAFGALMDAGAARAANARGPVVISPALSIDPVRIIEQSITRQSVEKPDEDKERTMGSQAMVRYGLYRYDVTVHPFHARRTGFTTEDFALLKDALINMYEFDQSSNRRLALRGIYAYRHASNDNNPCLGHAPRASLIDRVVVAKRDNVEEPLSFSDYVVQVHNDKLPEGITMELWN